MKEMTRKREWEKKREEKDASENTKSWTRGGREHETDIKKGILRQCVWWSLTQMFFTFRLS